MTIDTQPFAPIFIVGAGRSGTTLVRSLLSAHSRIAVTPETHFAKLAARHGGLATGIADDFKAFWAELTRSHRFLDLGIDPEDCRARITQAGAPTMRSIFRVLLEAYGTRCGKPRIGEKTPGHARVIPDLLDCFPAARIVVLRRDPRAVVASQLKTPWARSQITPVSLTNGVLAGNRVNQVVHYAADWADIYTRHIRPVLGDDRVMLVNYEDLLRDPERQVRALCAFVGEPFEPGMLSERSSDDVPPPAASNGLSSDWQAWRHEHNEKSRAPITPPVVAAWRSELTATEVAMIENCCADAMRAADYGPESSGFWRRGGWLGLTLVRSGEQAERRLRHRAARALGRV